MHNEEWSYTEILPNAITSSESSILESQTQFEHVI